MTVPQPERLTKDSVLCTLRQNQALLDRYRAREVGLFGLFATGGQTEDSDIDLLVAFERPAYDRFSGLTDELELLFGRRVAILTLAGFDSIRVPRVTESIRKRLASV